MDHGQQGEAAPRADLDDGSVGLITVGKGSRRVRVRGRTILRHACAGWVVDVALRKDHACTRTATHQASDGKWYCQGHDPADVPRMVQRLVRDGKLDEARLVALRRGVPWTEVTARRAGDGGLMLTGAQIDALEIAVRDHLSRLDSIPFRPEERGRHRRKLQGALAQLAAQRPGERPARSA